MLVGRPSQFDLEGIVEEPVAGGIRQGQFTDHIALFLGGQLAGGDGGTASIAVLDDLEQIFALGLFGESR